MATQADGHLPEPRVANFARWLVLVMETNPTTLLDCPIVTSDDIRRKQEIGDPYTYVSRYVLCKDFLPPFGSTDILTTWCYLVVSAQRKDSRHTRA